MPLSRPMESLFQTAVKFNVPSSTAAILAETTTATPQQSSNGMMKHNSARGLGKKRGQMTSIRLLVQQSFGKVLVALPLSVGHGGLGVVGGAQASDWCFPTGVSWPHRAGAHQDLSKRSPVHPGEAEDLLLAADMKPSGMFRCRLYASTFLPHGAVWTYTPHCRWQPWC